MATIEFHAHGRTGTGRLPAAIWRWPAALLRGGVDAVRLWHKRRRDRAAFLNLVGLDDHLYRDMGIHRGDVEWAAGLPLHRNAARELEKLRAYGRQGG